jgi:hypothetical protein
MIRVSIQGVKSLGGHFACLCRGIDFYEVKKKENGNTFTLLIIVFKKSLQKEQIAQITQYDGINLRSTQSDLIPRILTLSMILTELDRKKLLTFIYFSDCTPLLQRYAELQFNVCHYLWFEPQRSHEA